MDDITKEKIKRSYRETLERRKSQVCKVYELKVDSSTLSEYTKSQLNELFLEAKWLYNHILATNEDNDKIQKVLVKLPDGTFEERQLTILGSGIKQGIIERKQNAVFTLATLKRNNHKVGRLKFKSEVKSIQLLFYGNTWSIKGNRIRIQKINVKLKVRGLKQIPKEAELTSAVFIHRNGNYYLHITCFLPKKERIFATDESLGIDFGIKYALTLSNGIQVNYVQPMKLVKQLRRKCKELSKKAYKSKNYNKNLLELNKKYEYWNNLKKDTRNKIVSHLTSNYKVICIQNDIFVGWQRLWGKRMLQISIGALRSDMQTHTHTLIEVDTFFPSSQLCSYCNNRQSMSLDDRIYVCNNCKHAIDRDVNAAINIKNKGLSQIDVPMEHREVKPMETITNTLIYLKSVPYIFASYVCEVGS